MAGKVLINLATGLEDPERVTAAFLVATAALQQEKTVVIWTLKDAAGSTFGRDRWPEGTPRPQVSIEFEVDDVAAAVAELRSRGIDVLQDPKVEPWGQTTARLISPEGILLGLTYTPWLREGED